MLVKGRGIMPELSSSQSETLGSGGKPQSTTQGNGETPSPGETPTSTTITYDEWIGGQDEDTRSLIEDHTSGLKNALDRERSQVKELSGKLAELRKSIDDNTEAATQLDALREQLEVEQARAQFYEQATAAGCRDLKLAWLAASADSLTLAQVQEQHPDLFAPRRAPQTNAGSGSGTTPSSGPSMNDFIRRAAGRG